MLCALALTSINAFGQQVKLAKVTLGTSQDQVKQDLGQEYHTLVGPYMKNLTSVTQMLVGDATDGYWLLFHQNHLVALYYHKQFPPGQEPLVKVLEQSITDKTWPASHAKLSDYDPTIVWQTDAGGHPSTKPDQITAACSYAIPWTTASLSSAAGLATGPGGKTSILNLDHLTIKKYDPRCGVSIQMHPGFQGSPDVAHFVDFSMVDEKAMNRLVQDADAQLNSKRIEDNSKHQNAASPF